MPVDSATFLLHAPAAEKTIVESPTATGREQHAALLIAQTRQQKLFVTLEARRRYLTHTLVADSPGEVELDFVQDYAEVEALLEDAGLDGIHDGEQGIVYHNLLFLLMNP